jgi:ribulose-bisphosphate carboxylase large chain
MAHPSMAGVSIAPSFLLGKLFRLYGADATIFPNHGGRFGYTPDECRRLADFARMSWTGVKACAPVPAGGMSLERVPEILEFYGADVMLMVGGSLLASGGRITEETARYVAAVRRAV